MVHAFGLLLAVLAGYKITRRLNLIIKEVGPIITGVFDYLVNDRF
jgi:hypothetical protein